MTTPPQKSQYPNFKVDELFRWLRYIWKEAWVLGKDFSNDEQSLPMQGKWYGEGSGPDGRQHVA